MLKVAVIGAGSMGSNHARVYSELPNARLVGVVDSDPARAANVAAKYGSVPYTDIQTMIEIEKPDAVSIAVPTALHMQVADIALDAGLHILIEKPIAATLEEGQHIIQKAQACNRQVMVGHIVRFNPAIQMLKEKIAQGQLGRIFQIICRRVGPFPVRIQDVGVVIDLAPHDVDIMCYLAGSTPTRLFAETEQRLHTQHEDLLLGVLRFPGGLTGSLEINWLTPTKVREVVVLGERGLFRVDDLTQDLYFYENASADSVHWSNLQNIKGVREGSMIRYAVQKYEPLKAELQAFVDAIENNHPVPVSAEEGLSALNISLELLRSSRENTVIHFHEPD